MLKAEAFDVDTVLGRVRDEAAPRRRVGTARVVPVLAAVAGALLVTGPVLKHADNILPRTGSGGRILLTYMAGLFDLGTEANVPTWFATVTLAFLAAAFALAAVLSRAAGSPAVRFVVLAAVAAWLSLDEAAVLHEQLGRVTDGLRSLFGRLPTFSWVVPGAALGVTAGAALLWFGRDLPHQLRNRLVVAGALFLLGAVVVEAISGLVVEYHGYENLLYLVVNTVEEALEIAGTLLALRAVLSAMHVERGPQGLTVRLLAPMGA